MNHRCSHPLFMCRCQIDRRRIAQSFRVHFWAAMAVSGLLVVVAYAAVVHAIWGGR